MRYSNHDKMKGGEDGQDVPGVPKASGNEAGVGGIGTRRICVDPVSLGDRTDLSAGREAAQHGRRIRLLHG